MLLSTCVQMGYHKPIGFNDLVCESAIGVKYWKQKNVIVSAFLGRDLIFLFRVQVPVSDHEERLEVVILLGNTQPCVPDHVSHLVWRKYKKM